MIETGLLVYLLLMWIVVVVLSDDRDFWNFEIETSFIFDLRATRGVHLIVVDIILFRPYTRIVIIVIVRHGSTRAVQVYTYYILYVPTTELRYNIHTQNTSSIHTL